MVRYATHQGGSIFFFFAAFYDFLFGLNALFVCLSCSLLPACPPDVGDVLMLVRG